MHKSSCFPDQNVNHAKKENGTTQITQNGHSKAADYYVKGDVPAELTQRKVQ